MQDNIKQNLHNVDNITKIISKKLNNLCVLSKAIDYVTCFT